MKHQHREETDCLNCGAEITGKFCSNCGQENLNLHESFWHFLGHSFGHYFHFDSKIINTIKLLIIKPGQLSLDYLAGKRARYIQPVSLFIFISVVFFLITPLFRKKQTFENQSYQIITPDVYSLKMGLDSTLKSDFNKKVYEEQTKKFTSFPSQKQKFIIDSLKNIFKKDTTNRDLKEYITKLTIERKIKRFGFNDNTSEFMAHYGNKIFFLLTPIFAFFLMLNFRKNHKLYLEHIIYTLHFQSFVFIVLLFQKFLELINVLLINQIISYLCFAIILWYSYKSLSNFYNRSTGRTIWKMVGLTFLYLIALMISYLVIYQITQNLN
jgi:hypothetical protein